MGEAIAAIKTNRFNKKLEKLCEIVNQIISPKNATGPLSDLREKLLKILEENEFRISVSKEIEELIEEFEKPFDVPLTSGTTALSNPLEGTQDPASAESEV